MRKGNEGSLLEDNNGRFLGVRYEACWATMRDLEDWIVGTGKIIKQQPKRKTK